jgi:4-amino-4-deoxy-L-arabinose transferase-like glycosyltransferase
MLGKRQRVVVACLVVLAVAFVLRFKPASVAAQLEPIPDALEYALSSLSLYQDGVFAITINHVRYPPRYPFGFPLLLMPSFAFFGPRPESAIYVSLCFSLGVVAMAVILARALFGAWAALVAGAAAAIGHAYVTSGQQIMSDSAGAFLVLCSCAAVLRVLDRADGAKRGSLAQWALAGTLAGLATAVNLAHIAALAGLVVAAPALCRMARWPVRRSALAALMLVCGALPWLFAVLLYNWRTFGSPLQTGYGYWLSAQYGSLAESFSAAYLLAAPAGGPGNLAFYGRLLLGLNDSFYPAAFVICIVCGALVLWRGDRRQRQALLLGLLVCGSSLLLYSLYSYHYRRFILLPASWLVVIGAGGLQAVGRRLWIADGPRKRLVQLTGMAVLLAVAGGFAMSGAQTAASSYLLRAWLRPNGWQEYAVRQDVGRMMAAHTPADALILSGMPAPYLDYLVLRDTDRTAMPITRHGNEYALSTPAQAWPVADENPEQIMAALQQGRPVYVTDDPDTYGATGSALAALGQRFVLIERLRLVLPMRRTITLYQLESRE